MPKPSPRDQIVACGCYCHLVSSVDMALAQGGNYSGSRSVVVVEAPMAGDGIARLVDMAKVGHNAEGIDTVVAGRDCVDIVWEGYTTTGHDLSELVLALSVASWNG